MFLLLFCHTTSNHSFDPDSRSRVAKSPSSKMINVEYQASTDKTNSKLFHSNLPLSTMHFHILTIFRMHPQAFKRALIRNDIWIYLTVRFVPLVYC